MATLFMPRMVLCVRSCVRRLPIGARHIKESARAHKWTREREREREMKKEEEERKREMPDQYTVLSSKTRKKNTTRDQDFSPGLT
jgi:hypothetical protein